VTERELARGAARRLAIIRHAREVTGNVSATCRYFGIARQAFYKWLRRYEQDGLEGLRERSRRPHMSPTATKTEVVGKIMYLRELPTSARTRSRCTSSAITTLRSAPPACGGSSSAWR
jgi:transposase-like protein